MLSSIDPQIGRLRESGNLGSSFDAVTMDNAIDESQQNRGPTSSNPAESDLDSQRNSKIHSQALEILEIKVIELEMSKSSSGAERQTDDSESTPIFRECLRPSQLGTSVWILCPLYSTT